MPLPSSGQISVSAINTELGRASNTANSNFAGGTTPQSGSLFKLGEAGGINQTAPHAMSEWYNYAHEGPILVYQSSVSGNGPTYTSSGIWDDGTGANYTTKTGGNCSNIIRLDTGTKTNQADNHFILFDIQNSNGDDYYNNSFSTFYDWSITNYNNLKVEIGVYGFSTLSEEFLSFLPSSTLLDASNTSGTSSSGLSFISIAAVGTGSGPYRSGVYFKITRGTANWGGRITIDYINTNTQCAPGP
jgi:hypothetical protein